MNFPTIEEMQVFVNSANSQLDRLYALSKNISPISKKIRTESEIFEGYQTNSRIITCEKIMSLDNITLNFKQIDSTETKNRTTVRDNTLWAELYDSESSIYIAKKTFSGGFYNNRSHEMGFFGEGNWEPERISHPFDKSLSLLSRLVTNYKVLPR